MPTDLDKEAPRSADSSPSKGFLVSLEGKFGLQLLAILFAAALLCLPCLLYGIPPGYNAPTHVKYQHHFSKQFWSGESYPRWLADENKGYGSPIFIAQYPLPYFVTALLRPITSFPDASREARELGLFMYLALAAAGLAAWFWLRRFTNPLAATLAAIVYMALPYILEDGVYARDAIGELCSFIWMPLALSLCELMYQRRTAVFTLSGVFGLLVVSNLLSAILFAPMLTIYAILYGKRIEPSLSRRALRVLLAQLLGAGMASVYLVPLITYRRFFDLHQMEAILPGYQFGYYFLSMTLSNLKTPGTAIAMGGALLFLGAAGWYIQRSANFRIRISMAILLVLGALTFIPNLGLTIVRLSGFRLRPAAPPSGFLEAMLLGAFFTIALGFLAYCRVAGSSEDPRGLLLLYIAAVSFFMMLPFSAPVWKAFPGSSIIQFPYRLGGTLCIAVAGLVSMAFDDCLRHPSNYFGRPSRLVIALAAFGAVAGGFFAGRTDRVFRHPHIIEFDATQDVDPMYRAFVPLQQISAFAKTMGTAPDSYLVEPTPGDGTLRAQLTDGDCNLNVMRENPRALFISSDCKGDARLRIGQLYSPLWKIIPLQVASRNPTVNASADGLMELTLGPGRQDARLVFNMGAPERWGKILSVASLLVGVIGFIYFRKPTRAAIAPSPEKVLATP